MPTHRKTICSPAADSNAKEDKVTPETTTIQVKNDNDGGNAKHEKCKWRPKAEEVVIPISLFEPDRAVTASDAVQYAILCRKDVNINNTTAINKLRTTIEDMKHTIKGCLQT